MTKKEKLILAIQAFENTKEGTRISRYLELFTTVNSVLKQGSGLMWEDLVECIRDSKQSSIKDLTS